MTDTGAGTARSATVDVDKMADTIRSRVDLFGKALAAIATIGTGAVGLAKVADQLK